MATYNATGLAIFDPSVDPPLDNRPRPLSAQSASIYVQTLPREGPTLDAGNSLGDQLACRPTPQATQGEVEFFTPSEIYRTPHDVFDSCATTPLYWSPMVDPKTPASTYNGAFASPQATPATPYYERTKGTPNLHQIRHTADDPATVEGSSSSPSVYQTPFELVSIGAFDYRPTTVMNRIAPAPLDKGCRSSLSAGSEAPLEQDFQTPDGSPLSPYHTPPELLLGFRPPAGHRPSDTFGHPLSFLSFSSPSSPKIPRGTTAMHDAPTLDSTSSSTISNKEERSPILEVFQTARRLRNQRLHTTPLRRSHSSISLVNTGSPLEGSSLRAREMLELAEELQKARGITEDFVRSSPEKKSPPENRRLVRGNTFGGPPNKHGRHIWTSGGWSFDAGHARFPSNSTTSTAFFDVEEADGGNPEEMKPSRKSLSIITTWLRQAATPPPLLSPFKEKSEKATQDDDPLMTPTIETAGSPALPGDLDRAPSRRMQGQSDAFSTVRTPPCSPSPPLEGLRVRGAPAIAVEHPDLCYDIPTEKSGLLAEQGTTFDSTNSAQVIKRPTTNHGFTESSSSALGLSPSIYLSPMHESQFSNNSLDLAKIIKPEIERGLSTPSFISGVLQAGLLLEKLERENTTSFEEDMEEVHFQVLNAVVGTGKQVSSSSSLSHYSAEDSPKRSPPHLSSLTSAGTLFVTATDLSTTAQSSPPNRPAPPVTPHDSDLQPPSDHPLRLTLPPAPTFIMNPLPRSSSITASDSASFVQSLTKSFELDRGSQLLRLPSTDNATEPMSTRPEGIPSNSSLTASDRPQRNLSTDPSSFNRESNTEMGEGVKPETRVVTPSRVDRSSNRSTGQLSEDHPSNPQRISTLHPLSTSGSVFVSPASPSSVISRASARLANPFSSLYPSPLSSTSPYASDTSPAGPRKLAQTPEQPTGHQRSGTVAPGDMKRPSSARRRLSKLFGAVEFGIGGAASSHPEDKAGIGLVVPDVFGAGEGKESWIRNSREHATNHEGPASSDANAGREAKAAVQEEKNKKRRLSIRPTSMIWLGSSKEKSPMAARDGKQKVPLTLQLSDRPQPSNDSSNWDMLNANASGAVGNSEGLRIINLPPPAVGATIDVPKSRKAYKSRSRRRSTAVSSGGEESETEGGQVKGRSRSSFLGAFIKK